MFDHIIYDLFNKLLIVCQVVTGLTSLPAVRVHVLVCRCASLQPAHGKRRMNMNVRLSGAGIGQTRPRCAVINWDGTKKIN